MISGYVKAHFIRLAIALPGMTRFMEKNAISVSFEQPAFKDVEKVLRNQELPLLLLLRGHIHYAYSAF